MTEFLTRVGFEKDQGADEFSSFSKNADGSKPVYKHRENLPIYSYRRKFLYLVKKYQAVLVTGETGCGKSTQLPQYLHEAGWTVGKQILIAEPRRIAAISLAARVSEEVASPLGKLVGYRVRFDQCFSPAESKIVYVTNGMLLKMMISDPELKSTKIVIIDEVHERSVHVDMLLALIKNLILTTRPDLKLVISSASSDKEEIMNYLNKKENLVHVEKNINVGIKSYALNVAGREFDVKIHHSDIAVANYIEKAVATIKMIHEDNAKKDNGAILVFLSGQDEINHLSGLLNEQTSEWEKRTKMSVKVVYLYGGLSRNQQQRAFQFFGRNARKVILSTNIAETSVTVKDVRYVIDCGFERIRIYNPKSNIESLYIVPISKSSAIQRTGRAGRTGEGCVYRLYTIDAYRALDDSCPPEIQRTNNEQVLICLKSLKIDLIFNFPLICPLNKDIVKASAEKLHAMKILNNECKLTDEIGGFILNVPLDASLAMVLYAGNIHECLEEILSLVAILQVKCVFQQPKNRRRGAEDAKRKFCVKEGDHISLLNVYNLFVEHGMEQSWAQQNYLNYGALHRATEIRSQLNRIVTSRYKWNTSTSCKGDLDLIFKCILNGYFTNVACLGVDGVYKSVKNFHRLDIHKTSCLIDEKRSECVLFTEIVVTPFGVDEMNLVSAIKYNVIMNEMESYFRGRGETAGVTNKEFCQTMNVPYKEATFHNSSSDEFD